MSSSRNEKSAPHSVNADGARTGELPARDNRGSVEEQVRMRAYELYCERGSTPGDQVQDWLRAEREYFAEPKLVTEDAGDRSGLTRSSVERS